ncbi:MAG: JDVT-CTERM domain-containing protein [Pseudomonadota bacterium]
MAPADSLDGDFDTTEAAPYLVTGFDPFTGLAPGDQLEGLVVAISGRGQGSGFVTGEIEFQPKGLVDTGSREPLDPITLTMSVEVLPKVHSGDSENIFGCTMSQNRTRGVSDPTLVFMTMIAFLYLGMRRRNARKFV